MFKYKGRCWVKRCSESKKCNYKSEDFEYMYNHTLSIIHSCLLNYIIFNGPFRKVQVNIENVAQNEQNLDAKLEKKTTELERNQKRLSTLKKVFSFCI